MKFTFRPSVALLLMLVCLYTACKKSADKPTGVATIDYKTLGSLVATNFYRSLTGFYDGLTIKNGSLLPKTKAPGVNYAAMFSGGSVPLCGFTVDTTYTKNSTSGDTVKTTTNSYKLTYLCGSVNVNGYKVDDTLVTTTVSPRINSLYQLGQHFTVFTINPTYLMVSVNGSSFLNITDNLITPTRGTDWTMAYSLSDLTVDFTTTIPDIISGTVTFSGMAFYGGYHIPDKGTITFLGNYKAKFVFTTNNAAPYIVDLLTGAVTPA